MTYEHGTIGWYANMIYYYPKEYLPRLDSSTLEKELESEKEILKQASCWDPSHEPIEKTITLIKQELKTRKTQTAQKINVQKKQTKTLLFFMIYLQTTRVKYKNILLTKPFFCFNIKEILQNAI